VIFESEKKYKQKLNQFTFTFINSYNEEDSAKKLTFIPKVFAQSLVDYFTKNSPHDQAVNIISREAWGADETLRENSDGGEDWPRSYHGMRKVVLHHTGDAGSNGVVSLEDNMATMRSVYYYHAITNKWGDIGYNALVDGAGNVYEGRYGTPGVDFKRSEPSAEDVMVLDVEGAHTSSYNSGSFGISALGDFTSFELPAVQRAGIEKVLAFVADSRGINTQGNSDFLRYDGIWRVDLNNVFAHRDVALTACPGDEFYDEITSIKTEVDGFSGMSSNINNFSVVMGGSDIEGGEIGRGTILVDWDDFYGSFEYRYALEKVFGTIYDPQPYETAWMNADNIKSVSLSETSLETSLLEPYSQYVLYVMAVDSTGKPISTIKHLNFQTNGLLLPDLISPEIQIASPVDGYEALEKERIVVSVSATDNVGVEKIEVFLDNKLNFSCEGVEICDGKIAMFKESFGEHILEAKAYDTAGNSSSSMVNFTKVETTSDDPEPDPEPDPDDKPEKCTPWPACRVK